MKRVLAPSFFAACVIAAGGAYASAETDWTQLSGAVTIPSGETWYADESDMAAVNALTSITVSGATEGDEPLAAATLVFRSTVTPPKAGLLLGAGDVRKSGMSVWVAYANAQTGFTGDWHLDGGVVTNTAAGAFGNYDATGVTGKLYVHDGAALAVNNGNVTFKNREVHIAGEGNVIVPRALVVLAVANGGLYRLFLDGDAAIELGSTYWWNSYGSIIDLGEHTLSKYGSAIPWYFLQSTVKGAGGILFKEGNVTLRESSDWGGDENSAPFVFDTTGGTEVSFQFYNRTSIQKRPLQFNVPVSFTYGTNQDSGKSNLVNTNITHLAGDILLNGAGVKLKSALGIGYGNAQITLSGAVSGEGCVQVGETGTGYVYADGILCLAGHNTYKGTTAVLDKGRVGLLAYWPDSIPDYAKTHVTNSFIGARLGMAADGATARWTMADFWEMMNTVDFAKGGHLSLDATECEDSTYELAVSDIAENVPNVNRRILGSAGGTVKLRVNADEEQRIGLAADRGTTELVGGGTFRIAPTNTIKGLVTLDNADNMPIAEVRVTDGSTVVQNDECVHVGGTYDPSASKGIARLTVSNATWKTEFDTGYSSGGEPELGRGAIWVGHLNHGILEIQNGGTVSNKVVVGGGGNGVGGGANEGNGVGAVYLGKGGSLYIPRNGSPHLASNIGAAGKSHGYLEQSGGTLGGNGLTIANYGVGVVHVYGGEANFNGSLDLAPCNNGRGTLYITNGTWRIPSYMRFCQGSGCTGIATVDGAGANLLMSSDSGNIYGANNSNYSIRINVNHGGTLQFGKIHLYDRALLNNATQVQPFVLNVNGGVIKRHPNWSDSGMFGVNATNRFSRIIVYENGMTLDSNGKDIVQIAEMPFEGADGNGIMSIDLGGEVEDLIGAPRVVIDNAGDGAGYGATAVADWDPKTRTLKGVHVTSHGCGYTQGKVTVSLTIGEIWSKTLDGDAITVGANTPGGFTKRGAGTLTLNATNTWANYTKVEGGKLLAGSDWAIPAGTEITLSGGGILDFNGKTGEVARVIYGVGGGKLSNTENVVLPGAQDFTIDVEDILACNVVPFTGDIDLSQATLTITGDLDRLDPATSRRYTLVSVTGGTASGVPALSPTTLPNGWVVAASQAGVKIVRPMGAVFTLR